MVGTRCAFYLLLAQTGSRQVRASQADAACRRLAGREGGGKGRGEAVREEEADSTHRPGKMPSVWDPVVQVRQGPLAASSSGRALELPDPLPWDAERRLGRHKPEDVAERTYFSEELGQMRFC